jgi:two-component sensor histidine kinase
MSLRRRLYTLVAAASVPFVGILGLNGYERFRDAEQLAREEASIQVRLVAGIVSEVLEGSRQLATAIGERMREPQGPPGACDAYLKSIIDKVPLYVLAAVVDLEGRTVCASVPISRDVSAADRVYFRAALESDRIAPGTVEKGRASGRHTLPVGLRYRDAAGRVAGVVLLTINPLVLTKLLEQNYAGRRGFSAVLDRSGVVAAVSPEDYGGLDPSQPAAPALIRLGQAGSAVQETVEFGGRRHIAAVVPVSLPPANVTVVVGLDRSAVLAGARAQALRSSLVAALLLLASFGLAWWAARRLIQRPITTLVDAARKHAGGDMSARFPPGKPGTEFGQLAAALNAMAGEIERLLGQKTLLIREVQHRVMNSLQLLAAFLHLQSRQVDDDDVRRHLKNARERIVSMSVIYRHLYHSEVTSNVNIAETLKALCDETARAYMDGGDATIAVEAESVTLPMQSALSLALITHELVTNALKHGYPPGVGGPLHVALRRPGDRIELSVTDDGRGLPADFAPEHARSLGMAVILNLTRQLRGTFAAEPRPRGARFVVSFPAPDAPRAPAPVAQVPAPVGAAQSAE